MAKWVLITVLTLSLSAVAQGLAVGGGGGGAASGQGSGAIGSVIGGSGTVSTSGSLAGEASVGSGSIFGGLFKFGNAKGSGSAEGHFDAKGTSSSEFSATGSGGGVASGSDGGGLRLGGADDSIPDSESIGKRIPNTPGLPGYGGWGNGVPDGQSQSQSGSLSSQGGKISDYSLSLGSRGGGLLLGGAVGDSDGASESSGGGLRLGGADDSIPDDASIGKGIQTTLGLPGYGGWGNGVPDGQSQSQSGSLSSRGGKISDYSLSLGSVGSALGGTETNDDDEVPSFDNGFGQFGGWDNGVPDTGFGGGAGNGNEYY